MTQPGGEPCMENRSRMFFQLEAQTKGFVINASLGPGSAPGAAGRHGPPLPPWPRRGAPRFLPVVLPGRGPRGRAVPGPRATGQGPAPPPQALVLFHAKSALKKRSLQRGFVCFRQKRDADTWERGEERGACGGRDARRVLASPPAGGTRGAHHGVAAGAGYASGGAGEQKGTGKRSQPWLLICLRAGVAYRNK